jgi:hypothetical protein
MTDKDFRARLEDASRKLDAQKDAPRWLKDAVRASVKDAEALEPAPAREEQPSDFIYPH